MIETIILILVLVIIGILLSLPMLWPPLRRFGRYSRVTRRLSIFVFGMVAFLITYGGLTRFQVKTVYVFGVESLTYRGHSVIDGGTGPRIYDQDLRTDFEENESAIIHELWLRSLIRWLVPSLDHPGCLTGKPHVCELADKLDNNLPQSDASSEAGWSLVFLVLCLISTCATSSCVWLYTRPKRTT